MMQANELRELDAVLRLQFDLFLMRCFLTVNPGAIFMDNWHIDAMSFQIGRIAKGDLRRLIVNMPPRNLKSLAFNVALSAYLLGHDPPEAITEMLADRIDFYASPINAATPLINDGKLRALAVSSQERASALPDVPTTVQAGFPDSGYDFWVGVLLPKGASKPIVDAYHFAITKALAEPALAKKLAELGADPMKMSPPDFNAMIQREIKSNADVVKAAGIKVN